jgi:cell division protein FtsW
MLPVSGITLPFLSAGGSSLVITMLGAGILANVARQTPPATKKTATKKTATTKTRTERLRTPERAGNLQRAGR